MAIEIFKRAAGRVTQSTSARSHLPSDKGQPDIAHHSHSWAQPCGWAARMAFEEFLYILFYHSRQFVDCKRGHNLGNVRELHFGLEGRRENPNGQ